ncbi:MAG TPA: type II CAAX endopeptidase family protein, partial [Ktedonobacteraceae bacterium]|nr:type II CAAX endopeptidase family protein [Ktedonobacteraceae bacterium]
MSTIATGSQSATSSSLKRIISSHPLLAYFVIAFAGTWLLELPAILGKNGLALLPFTVPFALFAVLFILSSFAGPTLGAFLVTAITGGKPGVRQFLRRYVQWRVGLLWYLVVLFGYPVVYLLTTSIFLGVAPFSALIQNWPLLFTSYLPAILLFPGIITLGEEPGWRGFALPRLQQAYGPITGSLILGALHGLWHLPIFLIASFGNGPFVSPLPYLINVLQIMVITLIWTWIFNKARGSILIAFLNHSAFNANGSLFNTLVPVMLLGGRAPIYALAIVALLIIILTRGRLG